MGRREKAGDRDSDTAEECPVREKEQLRTERKRAEHGKNPYQYSLENAIGTALLKISQYLEKLYAH